MDFFDNLDTKGKIIVVLLIVNLLTLGGAFYLYKGQFDEHEAPIQKEDRKIVVHLVGEVRHPKVYIVKEGTRLFELIELAGGLTENADITNVNLAEKLKDESLIRIYSKQEKEENGYDDHGMSNGKININTASKELLMTLNGIGETKAERIIYYRNTYGHFRRIEDIMNVSGIGVKTFEAIKADITV